MIRRRRRVAQESESEQVDIVHTIGRMLDVIRELAEVLPLVRAQNDRQQQEGGQR